jgi:hypothetical protein
MESTLCKLLPQNLLCIKLVSVLSCQETLLDMYELLPGQDLVPAPKFKFKLSIIIQHVIFQMRISSYYQDVSVAPTVTSELSIAR